jgi:hypothetical protein
LWFQDCSQICIFLSIPPSLPPSLPLLCPCKPSHAERERVSNETQTHALQASSLQP